LDEDSELKLLSDRIKEYLQKDSITELKPLESSVGDSIKEIIETLSEQWRDNGYHGKGQTAEDIKKNVDDISKRW
jgi:hypothetical protein